jgi:FtsH-binding integral membrane protein
MAEPYNNLDRENRNPTYNDNFIMSNDQNNQRHNGDYDIKSENSEENTLSVNYMMRLGFIRKVYSVLTFQLILTALIASIGFIDSVKNYYMNNWWPFWVSFGIMIVTCIAISCFKTAARTVPTNYILLFLFTASESIIISFLISAINDPKIIAIAAISTIVVTSVLTIYACTTKTDFTFLSGILFVSLSLLVVLGFFYIWMPEPLKLLYCFLGLILYSVYLIYDTQLVMGKFGLEYSIDDYIIASLNIYIDIIQIFLYILTILSKKN